MSVLGTIRRLLGLTPPLEDLVEDLDSLSTATQLAAIRGIGKYGSKVNYVVIKRDGRSQQVDVKWRLSRFMDDDEDFECKKALVETLARISTDWSLQIIALYMKKDTLINRIPEICEETLSSLGPLAAHKSVMDSLLSDVRNAQDDTIRRGQGKAAGRAMRVLATFGAQAESALPVLQEATKVDDKTGYSLHLHAQAAIDKITAAVKQQAAAPAKKRPEPAPIEVLSGGCAVCHAPVPNAYRTAREMGAMLSGGDWSYCPTCKQAICSNCARRSGDVIVFKQCPQCNGPLGLLN